MIIWLQGSEVLLPLCQLSFHHCSLHWEPAWLSCAGGFGARGSRGGSGGGGGTGSRMPHGPGKEAKISEEENHRLLSNSKKGQCHHGLHLHKGVFCNKYQQPSTFAALALERHQGGITCHPNTLVIGKMNIQACGCFLTLETSNHIHHISGEAGGSPRLWRTWQAAGQTENHGGFLGL